MLRDHAARLGIRTISNLTRHLATIVSGFGPAFMHRPDGCLGLPQAYGLPFAHTPRGMNRNLLYQAIAKGSIDLGAGDSTDGRIASFDLVQREDDRRDFPPYEAIPLVSASALSRHPSLRSLLDTLAGQIDVATLRGLNRQVDEARRDPAAVAREFLLARRFLPRPRSDGPSARSL